MRQYDDGHNDSLPDNYSLRLLFIVRASLG